MKRRSRIILLLLSILFIFSILLTACQEELSQEDLETRQRILGEIKAELEKRPEYLLVKEELLDEDDELKSIIKYEYDDRANLVKANTVNSEGELIEKEMYLYDDNGLKVKKVNIDLIKDQMVEEVYEYNDNLLEVYYEKSLNGEKIEWRETEYHNNYHKKKRIIKREEGQDDELYYDRRGNLKKRISKRGDITEEVDYYYDEDGNKIGSERIQKDNTGEIIREIEMKNQYDNQGRRVSHEAKGYGYFLNQKIETYRKKINKYDEYGNRIKIIQKDGEGIRRINEYEHDEHGNTTLAIGKDSKEDITYKRSFNYKYNDKNKKIEIVEKDLLKDNIIKKEYYQYDENNNLIKEVIKDLKEDSIIENYYEYDDSGNLLRVRDHNWEGKIWRNRKKYYQKFNEEAKISGE